MVKLIVTIDRFEADKAVLILPDRQTLIVSKDLLPHTAKPGDCYELNFKFNAKATAIKLAEAKSLLSKIA